MEKVRLRVMTVPAIDPVTYQDHTAFEVILQDGGSMKCAPGWTLRDAVDNFCEWFHVKRETICLQRPFLPQRIPTHE